MACRGTAGRHLRRPSRVPPRSGALNPVPFPRVARIARVGAARRGAAQRGEADATPAMRRGIRPGRSPAQAVRTILVTSTRAPAVQGKVVIAEVPSMGAPSPRK